MDSYSLSDLAAVTRNANDDNGFGGNGAWWLILLFLFWGFNGNGFSRQSDFGQYATAASQQEILFGQQFGQINDRLTNIGNGICNLGYEMQGNIAALGKDTALGMSNLGQRLDANTYSLSRQIADCCCETQRGIDSINANIEAKFAAIEKLQLEQRIAEQSARIASLEMDNRFCGVVRYPMTYAYSAGASPFCGCNNGCGCNNI